MFIPSYPAEWKGVIPAFYVAAMVMTYKKAERVDLCPYQSVSLT